MKGMNEVVAESTIVKRLNLSNYGLKSIDFDISIFVPYLEDLDVSNNELENINIGCNLLRKLDCSNNKLNHINFAQELPNLEELYISGNSLTLADHYIAATLCPQLKRIDGEFIKFNINEINKQYDQRLWPHVENIWKTKFEKNYKTNAKFDKLIQSFIERVKAKKLYTEEGFEKFRDFKVEKLIENLLTEVKSINNSRLAPSKTYSQKRKRDSKELEDDSTMLPGARSRSTQSSGFRKFRSIQQHERLSPIESVHLSSFKSMRGKCKSTRDINCETIERKHKRLPNFGDIWQTSARRKVDIVDTMWEPSSTAALSDVKCHDTICYDTKCHDTKCHDKKCHDTNCHDTKCHDTKCRDTKCRTSKSISLKKSMSKSKKQKLVAVEEQSFSSRDEASSNECSDSDISLLTATERALNFIQTPQRGNMGKLHRRSSSRQSRPSRTSILQKYNLKKPKDIDFERKKKSKIPAPSRTATVVSGSPPNNKFRLLRASQPFQKVKNKDLKHKDYKTKDYKTKDYKNSKLERSDKSSSRRTHLSIRSSRTLRNEIAIYNDIENWCDDIHEHFLPDEQNQPVAIKKVESDDRGKSRTFVTSPAESQTQLVKTFKPRSSKKLTLKPSHSKIIPLQAKVSIDKPQSRKSNGHVKKSKRYQRKLAPLIVSGDEESLDLDPSVNPNTLKCKFIDRSDSESSENFDQDSSKSTWKKNDSESDFSCSAQDEIDSESEDDAPLFPKRCIETQRTKKLELRDKDSTSSRKSSHINSKMSMRSDDLSLIRKQERNDKDIRQLHQNPSRLNLIEFSEPEIQIMAKPKLKPSITSRAEPMYKKREIIALQGKPESNETPRTKLAEKKSRLSIDERTYSIAVNQSLMDRDWNPLHFLKCHSGDNCIDDDKTQVWHCAFEPETSADKNSHFVATCGGQTVCLIDCESGRIVNRYKHARSSEEFFTLAWTTLKIENGKGQKKINVLAVGGKRGMILLLQPNQLICYAELSGHKDMISGLNFHGEMPQILCSGSTDGTIIVWDIGIPKGADYETDWKHIHIIKVQYDVLNVLFVPQVDFLLAGTENSCWGWTFDGRRPSIMSKMPSVEFVHPTKVSGTVQMESVVDAIVLVSKNVVASKCAGYKCIYLWDISATILSTIKKLSRGVRLNIQVLAILQWSDNDNFYLNMGCSKESKILACGDACGKLWIYQLQELLANKCFSQKSQQQVVSPVILIDWPECRLKSNNKSPEREVNLNNVVINSVSVSSDARYITAVTDKNIVCIWN